MDFRLLNSAFLPQAAELWDYCFEKKGDPFYERYFSEYCLKQNSVIGGFDGDKLACMLHLNPYAITLRGQTLRLPYIVGVATAPEYRGQHLTRPLLETAFTVLRAQGAAFALLMPIPRQYLCCLAFRSPKRCYRLFISPMGLITAITAIITRCRWQN